MLQFPTPMLSVKQILAIIIKVKEICMDNVMELEDVVGVMDQAIKENG
jgi:hypothetical protein